jgi:hypothetical protein
MGGMLRRPAEDRVVDWRDEMRRIERQLPDLPVEARAAVQQVLERFRAEDAGSRGKAA